MTKLRKATVIAIESCELGIKCKQTAACHAVRALRTLYRAAIVQAKSGNTTPIEVWNAIAALENGVSYPEDENCATHCCSFARDHLNVLLRRLRAEEGAVSGAVAQA